MTTSVAMRDIIQRASARAFLVGIDRSAKGRATATVHAAQSATNRADLDALCRKLMATGAVAKVRLRRHSDRELAGARSIETLLAPMRHEEILFDATGVVDRGGRLLRFTRALRSAMGEKIGGIYWNPRWRTLYVRLDRAHYLHEGKLRVADLAGAELAAKAALADVTDENFRPAVRLGFDLPATDLVPVDDASLPRGASVFGMLRHAARLPAIGLALGLGTVAAANAQEAPAVSAVNGKLAIIGGLTDDDTRSTEYSGVLAGSLTVPLSHSFGFQADAAAGSADGNAIVGVGGHLFWRDPSSALVGAIASYAREDVSGGPELESIRLGGETEIYLGDFTVQARAGHQFGHNVDDGFFGRVDVSWYATDDFRLRLGVANDPIVDTTVSGDVEFRPGYEAMPGLAYFADAAAGDDNYVRASIGVRFYFGENKSLKRRHREDDPEDNLGLEGLNSVTAKTGKTYGGYVAPLT